MNESDLEFVDTDREPVFGSIFFPDLPKSPQVPSPLSDQRGPLTADDWERSRSVLGFTPNESVTFRNSMPSQNFEDRTGEWPVTFWARVFFEALREHSPIYPYGNRADGIGKSPDWTPGMDGDLAILSAGPQRWLEARGYVPGADPSPIYPMEARRASGDQGNPSLIDQLDEIRRSNRPYWMLERDLADQIHQDNLRSGRDIPLPAPDPRKLQPINDQMDRADLTTIAGIPGTHTPPGWKLWRIPEPRIGGRTPIEPQYPGPPKTEFDFTPPKVLPAPPWGPDQFPFTPPPLPSPMSPQGFNPAEEIMSPETVGLRDFVALSAIIGGAYGGAYLAYRGAVNIYDRIFPPPPPPPPPVPDIVKPIEEGTYYDSSTGKFSTTPNIQPNLYYDSEPEPLRPYVPPPTTPSDTPSSSPPSVPLE